MALIALTGGIASGKSTIAHRLEHHGATIVDADAIVREVQQPGSPVLAEIAAEFGAELINEKGELDRAALGKLVFGDEDAVARLNAIVHPAVKIESQRRFVDAQQNNPGALVVYDVPLLVEARLDEPWDLIVVADAPADVRLERLVNLRGFDRETAAARIASQVSDQERRAIADVIIDTSGTLEYTLAQTDALWQRLQQDSES